MRASLIIASHNEGERLWRTVAACVETSAGLDCEIIVADDASWDESVAQTLDRFPQVRVVRHAERQGASPTKDLGARQARGDVLIFLDAHTNPEPGALQRLIEDVERFDGNAIIMPVIAGLCVTRWKTQLSQAGHGLTFDLQTLDTSWLPLAALREHRHKGRTFYESPALAGGAFAVSRELYDDLRGFDPHMLCWGVEDLDFGLKAWLLGHPILHDPEPIIGHRFQQRFDNFEVPIERLIVNQLRMARKNFTDAVWSDWLERCRKKNSGPLANHPEGLWARVWQLFGERRPSVEQERAHLLARRLHDEFWFADRFDLPWPKLQSDRFEPSLRAFGAGVGEPSPTPSPSPSPTPPPCECKVSSVSGETNVCVRATETYTITGECMSGLIIVCTGGDVTSGPSGNATQQTFTIDWLGSGEQQITVSCGDSSAMLNVTVVQFTFDRDPIKTGYVITGVPPQNIPLWAPASLTADPPSGIAGVTLVVRGEPRIELTIVNTDIPQGQINFKVGGKTATEQPLGDTWIDVKHNGHICKSVPVLVVIPTAIGPDHPEPMGPVTPYNHAANRSTSPKYSPALLNNFVHLWTIYAQWLNVPVNDQFGSRLDAIYQGQKVYEKDSNDVWQYIWQDMAADGTYRDPVFSFTNKTPPPVDVLKNSVPAKDWVKPSTAVMALTPLQEVQNYSIRIDGHVLTTGIVNRTIDAILPDIVNITWP